MQTGEWGQISKQKTKYKTKIPQDLYFNVKLQMESRVDE